MKDLTKVFNCDCMIGMKEFPDKHFDLAIVDDLQTGYLLNRDVKDTMNFRCRHLKGTYKDENINIKSTGRYLHDLTLENCLKSLCQ